MRTALVQPLFRDPPPTPPPPPQAGSSMPASSHCLKQPKPHLKPAEPGLRGLPLHAVNAQFQPVQLPEGHLGSRVWEQSSPLGHRNLRWPRLRVGPDPRVWARTWVRIPFSCARTTSAHLSEHFIQPKNCLNLDKYLQRMEGEGVCR